MPTISEQPGPAPKSADDSQWSVVDPTEPSAPAPIAVIGGAKFDEAKLESWLRSLPRDTIIVTGDGRGAERMVRELAAELGLRVDVPELHSDWYLKKDVLPLQVGDILRATRGDVYAIGTGARVQRVRDWYKRTQEWRKPARRERQVVFLP